MSAKTHCLQSRNPTEDKYHKLFEKKKTHCSKQGFQC